jgi:hypothetical protein
MWRERPRGKRAARARSRRLEALHDGPRRFRPFVVRIFVELRRGAACKTTSQLAELLRGSENLAGYWWVRHVCGILTAREILKSRIAPVAGQTRR